LPQISSFHIYTEPKKLYADATFKLCRHPFSQLFTINAFVREVKQVPLVFVLMSHRRKSHVTKVLEKLVETIPTRNIQRITIDFEKGPWQAFRRVMPEIEIKGCLFQTANFVCKLPTHDDKAMNSFIRRIMALPSSCMKPSRQCLNIRPVQQTRLCFNNLSHTFGTTKVQRKKHKLVQAKIFNLWDAFNNKEKTLEQLLKAANYLNRPTIKQVANVTCSELNTGALNNIIIKDCIYIRKLQNKLIVTEQISLKCCIAYNTETHAILISMVAVVFSKVSILYSRFLA
jgi:hypothetical protein